MIATCPAMHSATAEGGSSKSMSLGLRVCNRDSNLCVEGQGRVVERRGSWNIFLDGLYRYTFCKVWCAFIWVGYSAITLLLLVWVQLSLSVLERGKGSN